VRADFHDWRINEVFSDRSGNIQFIEFHNVLEDGEEFLSGHVLSSSGGSITFDHDLPSDQTLNKSFLVATADFASLPGAPAPDFLIPANFLNPAGDAIDYTGVDSLTFGALPDDGKQSLARDLSTGTNSPTNFAGTSGSIDAGLPTGIPLPPAAIPGAIGLLLASCITRVRRCF
jgi:hypothetical protein